jgi:hypothetical protein
MGQLKTSGLEPGHRIFVQGQVVGQTPQSVLIKCGSVTVKIGASGRARTLDVPCGAELDLDIQ